LDAIERHGQFETNGKLASNAFKECNFEDFKDRNRNYSINSDLKIIPAHHDGSHNAQSLPTSILRCHACRAEALPQFTPVSEDAKSHSLNLYSEPVKSSTNESSENPKVPLSVKPKLAEEHEITNVMTAAMPRNISSSGSQIVNSEATESQQDTNLSPSKSKPLRAEAAVFIPESTGANNITASGEELARNPYLLNRPPMMELLTPNCPGIGSQNALSLTLPNLDADHSLHQEVYDDRYNLVDYIPGQDVGFLKQYPWLIIPHQTWGEKNAFGSDKNKIQTADPHQFAARSQQSTTMSPPIAFGPRELSTMELKKMNGYLDTQVLMSPRAQQSRIVPEIAQGPTVYPYTTENASRELTNMLVPLTNPGHCYVGENVLPNPMSRELEEIENAIRLINLKILEGDSPSQKWWEPPIPFGFDARACFNQPHQQTNSSEPALCGSKQDQFNGTNFPVKGCKYCDDDAHLTGGCPRRKFDAQNMKERCLNCNSKEHFLRDCLSPIVFDNTESRATKLQWYARTEHWRQTLARQHDIFYPKSEEMEYPTLASGMSDPSLEFSWLNSTPCMRGGHWGAIQVNA
jgi:hypothetical protein